MTSPDPDPDPGPASVFRALHERDQLLLLPNPYDLGTAVMLASMGFEALATSSAGLARTMARPDGARAVGLDEAIEHAIEVQNAVRVPVTADLERGFADEPAGVAATVAAARDAGIAGCCIEDSTSDQAEPIYDRLFAVERIVAAAEAAHSDGHPFVLTARAENYLHGRPDLSDTISRLLAFAEAGADAFYAPGLTELDEIASVVDEVPGPVNVLIGLPGQRFTLDDLADVGVRRVSVGSAMSRAAFAAVHDQATVLLRGDCPEPVGGGLPDLDRLFAGTDGGRPQPR